MEIIPAFLLGFLGSFHCVGMCGPIAFALPLDRRSAYTKIYGILMYNFGRVFTYSIFGALFGLLGKGFVIAGFQQTLSIFAGTFIILLVLFSSTRLRKLMSFSYSGIGALKRGLGRQLRNSGNGALFLTGVLNGLLPCGLVYLGIAGAIAMGTPLHGSIFMAMFGFGTLPAMIVLMVAGNSINGAMRSKIRKGMPYLSLLVGVLLIVRGMNLGIPYLSPQMSAVKAECHKCCNK